MTNFGILPGGGSVHLDTLQNFVVKLAMPLLLLGADMGKIFREAGELMKAFVCGMAGTMAGSIAGYALFAYHLQGIGTAGDDAWKIAGALTAKNIGGGLNYMAVVDALRPSDAAVSLGLAVDNILGLIYFPFISWLGSRYNSKQQRILNSYNEILKHSSVVTSADDIATNSNHEGTVMGGDSVIGSTIDKPSLLPGPVLHQQEMNVGSYVNTLAVGLGLVAAAEHMSNWCTRFGVAVPSIALSSVLSVVLATAAPGRVRQCVLPGELMGRLLLLVFCSCIGNSSGNLLYTFGGGAGGSAAAALMGFGLVLYAVHLLVISLLCRLLRISTPKLLLASNANVGNAATASALAAAMGWQAELLPAVLVGNFGNFIGTFTGLWLANGIFRTKF